jgi:transcription elongation factor Elf1
VLSLSDKENTKIKDRTNDRLFTCIVCGKQSEVYDSTIFCSRKCEIKYKDNLVKG